MLAESVGFKTRDRGDRSRRAHRGYPVTDLARRGDWPINPVGGTGLEYQPPAEPFVDQVEGPAYASIAPVRSASSPSVRRIARKAVTSRLNA